MKKKNREINIFNLSMLDVLCGAMGAFLAIMIILLPYYTSKNKTFLVVHIAWNTGDDVDLHVVDPNGKTFSWEQGPYPNYPGELSVDSTTGPGNEVWISQDAAPGEYKIMANLYSGGGGNPPVVTGKVVSRGGDTPLKAITLTEQCAGAGCPKLMATVVVEGSGNVTVR